MTFAAEEAGEILSQGVYWCRGNVVSRCWRSTTAAG
jgi:hypothetical protein